MESFAFDPAFPFPVPTTGTVDLQLQQPLHSIPVPDRSLHPDPEMMKEADATLNDQTPSVGGNSSRRKRGRPRKLKPTTEPNFQQTVVEPPVSEDNGPSVVKDVSEVVQEKRVARPVKRFGADVVRRDVVKKNKKGVFKGPLGYPKRGRGRPPKSRFVADVFNGPLNMLAIAGMKRRGRPKRSVPNKHEAVAPKVIGRGSKKEKVGSQVLGPVAPQWMVDYAHVRAKIDHIQSRMREAIGVIKPQLMNQNVTNGHIGTALQELDQISTMDVMAVSLAEPVEELHPPAETQVY